MVCYEVHNRKNVHFIYILRFEKKNKGFQRSLWTAVTSNLYNIGKLTDAQMTATDFTI